MSFFREMKVQVILSVDDLNGHRALLCQTVHLYVVVVGKLAKNMSPTTDKRG